MIGYSHTTIVTCPAYEGEVSVLPYAMVWTPSSWELDLRPKGWHVDVPMSAGLAGIPLDAAVLIQVRSPLSTYWGLARIQLIDEPGIDREVIARFVGVGPLYKKSSR